MRMRKVANMEAVKEVGDWYIRDMGDGREKHMIVKLPGQASICSLLLGDGTPASVHPSWKWNGRDDKPSLLPSVNVVGLWHGWIKDGELVSC